MYSRLLPALRWLLVDAGDRVVLLPVISCPVRNDPRIFVIQRDAASARKSIRLDGSTPSRVIDKPRNASAVLAQRVSTAVPAPAGSSPDADPPAIAKTTLR